MNITGRLYLIFIRFKIMRAAKAAMCLLFITIGKELAMWAKVKISMFMENGCRGELIGQVFQWCN